MSRSQFPSIRTFSTGARRKSVILSSILLWITTTAGAAGCQKITLTGYNNWPPYSFEKEEQLKGAGVDIASQIFEALDIPVIVQHVEKPSQMRALLNQGKIDLIFANYRISDWQDSVQVIEPPFFEDAVAIIAAKDKTFPFERWYDLMGHTGVALEGLPLGERFTDFAGRYLSITHKSTLKEALDLVAQHEADYVVGSAELLRSHLIQDANRAQFAVLPNLVGPENVYLAFSKNSPCKEYLPFVEKQLERLKKEGTVERLLEQYAAQ